MNEVKIVLFGLGLLSVVLGLVFLDSELLLSVKSVSINGNFAVSSHHNTLLGQNERVDFDHVAIFLDEALV